MSESPAGHHTDAMDDHHGLAVEIDVVRVWTACAVSVTALLHLAAVVFALSRRTH